jgi:hypothetical protein
MTAEDIKPEDLEWRCHACDQPLVAGPVQISYMGNRFTTDLPRCPQCGWVLISEAMALGKMAELEQTLEDK